MPDLRGCEGLRHSVRDGSIQGRSRSHPEPVEFLLVYFFPFLLLEDWGFVLVAWYSGTFWVKSQDFYIEWVYDIIVNIK